MKSKGFRVWGWTSATVLDPAGIQVKYSFVKVMIPWIVTLCHEAFCVDTLREVVCFFFFGVVVVVTTRKIQQIILRDFSRDSL